MVLGLCFTSDTFSQQVKFGIIGGIDISNVKTQGKRAYFQFRHLNHRFVAVNYHPLLTYNFNGYVAFRSKSCWGFSLEPGFMRKGSILKYDSANKNLTTTYWLNYAQFPFSVDFYLSDNFFISIGSEISYLLKSTIKDQRFVEHSHNNLELSGLIGMNILLSERIDIGFRYNQGITNLSNAYWKIFDSSEDILTVDFQEINKYYQLFIRYKIKT